MRLFFSRRAERLIFITSQEHPACLLPGLDDDLMELDIDEEIKNKLIQAAVKGIELFPVQWVVQLVIFIKFNLSALT